MKNILEYDTSLFYRCCRIVATVLSKFLYRLRVTGANNLPESGPAIICCNHIHNFDPFIVGLSTKRFLYFMAKEELFQVRIFSGLFKRLGAFPVHRGGQDKGAIRQAVNITRQNGCLVIFPEGHRSKDGKIGKGMMGAAFIARKAQCRIVPTAIVGNYKFRGGLKIRFGEPILPLDDDTNESLIHRIMENISTLVEEERKMS